MKSLLSRFHFFSEQQKQEISEEIIDYVRQIKKFGEFVTEKKSAPKRYLIIGEIELLKICNRYVFCKRCMAKHLTGLLGKTVLADDITDLWLSERYFPGKARRYIAYQEPGSNIIYLARRKHFGIYVEYRERGNSNNNFFMHK